MIKKIELTFIASKMSENYFYLNHNQPSNRLYFKEWVPNIYLPNVKTLRRNNINIAESQCCQELEEAITTCGTNNSKNKQKLVDILSQFNATSKVCNKKWVIYFFGR